MKTPGEYAILRIHNISHGHYNGKKMDCPHVAVRKSGLI